MGSSEEIIEDKKFNQAQEKLIRGDLEGALKLFQELVKSNPNSVTCQLMLASTYKKVGDLENASMAFRECTIIAPEKETISLMLFHSLYDLGQKKEAIVEAKRLLALKGSARYEKILNELETKSLLEKERGDSRSLPLGTRISRLENIILGGQTSSDIYLELARLQMKSGEMNEAKKTFYCAIEANPEYGWNYLFLGNWYYHVKDYAEALTCFEKAQTLMPNNSAPLWSAAEMLEKLDRFKEADAKYREAVKLEPDDEEAQKRLDLWEQRMRPENSKWAEQSKVKGKRKVDGK